jgi:hypothetical protein
MVCSCFEWWLGDKSAYTAESAHNLASDPKRALLSTGRAGTHARQAIIVFAVER